MDGDGGPGVGGDAEFSERTRDVRGDGEIEHAGFGGAIAGFWVDSSALPIFFFFFPIQNSGAG